MDLTGLVLQEWRVSCDAPDCDNGVTFGADTTLLHRSVTLDIVGLEWELHSGDLGAGIEYYWQPVARGEVQLQVTDTVDPIDFDAAVPGDSVCESTADSLGGTALLDVALDDLGPDDELTTLDGKIRAQFVDGSCRFTLELHLWIKRYDGFDYTTLTLDGSVIAQVTAQADLGCKVTLYAHGTYADNRCPDEVVWTIDSLVVEDYDMGPADWVADIPHDAILSTCGEGDGACDEEDPCYHLFGSVPYVDETYIGADQFTHVQTFAQTDPGITFYV